MLLSFRTGMGAVGQEDPVHWLCGQCWKKVYIYTQYNLFWRPWEFKWENTKYKSSEVSLDELAEAAAFEIDWTKLND